LTSRWKISNAKPDYSLEATGPSPSDHHLSSVVSRETVRLALTIAALNDLEVEVGDVLNAYITAPVKEKVWTVLGPEFGRDAG
jgi:hypothetical protein